MTDEAGNHRVSELLQWVFTTHSQCRPYHHHEIRMTGLSKCSEVEGGGARASLTVNDQLDGACVEADAVIRSARVNTGVTRLHVIDEQRTICRLRHSATRDVRLVDVTSR